MSGSGLLDAFFDRNSLSLAKRQAALLNCPADSSRQLKNCLMKKDAQEIASSLSGLTVSTISKYSLVQLSFHSILNSSRNLSLHLHIQTMCQAQAAYYPVSKGALFLEEK
jgi:hypothetical protein